MVPRIELSVEALGTPVPVGEVKVKGKRRVFEL